LLTPAVSKKLYYKNKEREKTIATAGLKAQIDLFSITAYI
jgi:hypothetical protein